MAVIGSGVIGTEFAFILSMLGKRVTWITQSKPLANSSFSLPALKLLNDALESHNTKPRMGSRTQSVDFSEPGVTLNLADGSEEKVDWVLLGTGRTPHTASLNLEAAGITPDAKGFIPVNSHLQTNTAHIYAIGEDDVLKYALEFCEIHQEQSILFQVQINEHFFDGCIVTLYRFFRNQLTNNDSLIGGSYIFLDFRLFGIGIDRVLLVL